MGFMDKFKNIIDGGDIDDGFVGDADENDTYEDEEYEAVAPKQPVREVKPATQPKSASAVNINVFRPKQYANVAEIAKCLLNHTTVILNLEETNKEDARRIIDFLSGVVFSIEGQIEPVTDSSYVITPTSESISYTKLDGVGETTEE